MNRCARAVFRPAARLGVVLLVAALVTLPSNAQTFRGTILGTVSDQSGAVIVGAKVTAKNTATGLTRETETTSDGSYSIPELPIGTYDVTVEKAGFQTAVVTGVRVDVAAERRVDAILRPGEVAQRVEVSGEELPQVDATTDMLGGIMEPKLVANLPVNGRDYTKLIFMVPGIAGSPDQITDSPGSFGVFSMNGARGRANNFLLDGTDMNDGYRNDPAINEAGVFGDPATILPLDAVAELRVLSNYEPEYGRNAGAVINIVTKSGTNDFHGTALEYFRNNALDARNFFNFKPGRQNPFHNNQFGGSLGGPIIHDKTFFFLDYEGQRESGAQSSLGCVPTANSLAIATASIAPAPINPVTAALLKRNPWPAPNINVAADDTGCPNGPNFSSPIPFKNDVSSMIAKVDHNFTKNNLVTGRYYFGDSDQSFPLGLVGSGFLPGFNTVTPTRVQLVSISWVSVRSATQVNEARVGWNRFAEGFFPEDQNFNPASIGLNTGVGPRDFGLPRITVSGTSGGFALIGANTTVPRQRVDTNWHFIDNFSWKIGRHDLKFGFEWRRTSISQFLDFNFRGKLTFNSLEDFLTGTVDGGSQARGDTNRNTFENNYGWYVQDSFRWTPRLTLNFGVRWDYYGVIEEKHGLFFNFDPVNGFRQEGAPTLPRLYEPDYRNFAPRVSLAYDLTGKGKTVIRAGYGIFYDAFSQDFYLGHFPFNCTFCPGPAYSGSGPGNTAITTGGIAGGFSPVYSGFSALPDFFGVDRHIRTPYMQNFNLNVQQEITRHAVLQVGYVGSNGHRLFRFRDVNQPGQAQTAAADVACNCIESVINTTASPRVFASFPPGFTSFLNFEEGAANSNYNSLQVSFRLRGWHGLDSTANYVWSRSIDNASDGEDFVPNQGQPNDSTRANLEKGNSSFDIRNRFVWNFIYEFPKLKGSWSKLTDGWGFNGVVTLQGGQPFHLNYNFEGDFDGSGEGFGRPDVVGPIRYNRSDPSQFLDLSSFAVSCTIIPPPATTPPTPVSDQNCVPGSRRIGNLGRNSLRADDYRNFDFSIFKNTPLTERISLQFRAEFYNIFNHPNFTNPILPAFIADASPNGIGPNGRHLGFYSLASTADVGIGNPFLGGGGPRGIQLALKLLF